MSAGSKTVSDSIAFSLVSALAVASTSTLSIAIAIRFGAGYEADVFFLAYAVPGVVVSMMAATMRVVLVPSFVRFSEGYGSTIARRMNTAIGIVGLALWLVVASVGVAVASLYIETFAPSLSLEAQYLAVQISRWVFAIIPLTWLSEFLRALLYSQHRFLLPLAAECCASVLATGLILGLGKHTGILIVCLALVVKMLTQIAVSALGFRLTVRGMWPALTAGYRYRIWSVLRGLTLRFGGALLRQSSVTVERFWSAYLGVGAVSALSYAQMGVNTLSNIFSTSVATVLLPALSRSVWTQQEGHGGPSTNALRLALFFTAPVAAFSALFSYPACQVIFAFSDTLSSLVNLTSRLLAIYALRIPTMALISVLLTPFYALEDVQTPVKHMSLMLGVNLALDVLLFPIMNIYAFPTAAVLTDVLSIARAIWLQRRIEIRYPIRDLGRDLIMILISVGMAVLVALAIYYCGVHIIKAEGGGQLVMLSLAAILGGVAYLAATRVAGIPEARIVTAMLRQRVRSWGARC